MLATLDEAGYDGWVGTGISPIARNGIFAALATRVGLLEVAGKEMVLAETIGFIGLGIMGKPMARNLAKAGYQLVLHNRSRDAVDELLAEIPGSRSAENPAAVASLADTVITMVPDSPDVREVVFGLGGLIETVTSKSLVIDMSTIATSTALDVHDAVTAKGGASSMPRSAAVIRARSPER